MTTRRESIELGERIKKLRLAQNLTLKELEAKAGVSATHLSEIERGLSSPTVGAVARVARALGEDPALLVYDRTGPRHAVVRRANRRTLASGSTRLHALGSPIEGAEMSLVELELAPEGDFAPMLTGGEEIILVLSGEVEVRLNDMTHQLAEGDALHCRASEDRLLRARQAARVLWIVLPAVTL